MIATRHPMWDLVRIGELLGGLQYVTDESGADDICECIRELQDVLDDLQLEKSAECAEDWSSILLEDLETRLETNPEAEISGWTDDLRDIARDLMSTIRDEANRRSVFVVPEDKFIDVERLIDNPLEVLCSKVSPGFPIPSHAQEDLQEAVECYAIGRPAATIVFSLRATEALLREFHSQITQSVIGDKPGWARLTKVLVSSDIAVKRAVEHRLEQLRQRRNDAMHAGPRDSKRWNDRAARKVMRDFGKVLGAMWREHTKRQAAFLTNDHP